MRIKIRFEDYTRRMALELSTPTPLRFVAVPALLWYPKKLSCCSLTQFLRPLRQLTLPVSATGGGRVPCPLRQRGQASLSFPFYHCDNLLGPSTNASVGPPPFVAGRCALQSVIFDKIRSPHSRIERLCGDDFYFIGLYIFISP
jgi:hypothetical protein